MFRLVQPENGLMKCYFLLNKQLLYSTNMYWSVKKFLLSMKRDMKKKKKEDSFYQQIGL